MRKQMIWALLLSVASLVGCHDEELNFAVTLSGSQEVPPVQTTAMASGTVTLLITQGSEDHFFSLPSGHMNKEDEPEFGNDDTYTLSAEIDISAVDNVLAAHIHQGSVGENGSVAFEFTDNGDGTMIVTETDITMEQAGMLMGGEWYINVHTQQAPPGEVRGQIVDADTQVLAFALSGRQEVPALDTDAFGHGYATVNTVSNDIDLTVLTTGVEDAVAAHIHEGEIGANGGVVVFLEQSTEDATVWQTPDGTSLETDVVETMLAGGHYVNIHTPGVPSGEIRGQIFNDTVTVFAFGLSGDEEVPPVVTDAAGDGYVWFDGATGLLSVLILTTGLEEAVAAHVHQGEIGTNGGVAVELEQDTGDVNVWRSPDNAMLDEETANILLMGGHYLNIHTPAVPSGEVRGQID
ncbi:CHRD domain-containing protein [Photobacterium makurazakiensis]|uniref:CHRD domain-containing protein n=1 Tax=Photobacterium makurazakiensis TaxID=2910234 RepID=UPI003D09CB0D